MVTDKVLKVYTADGETFRIVITGEQLTQTARRRMHTLMPKARINDITEEDGEQGDSSPKKRGGAK